MREVNRFSIKDIETITGIRSATLRIWEHRYDLLQPKRTDTNIRFYDDQDLRLLLNVSILIDNGFKISEVANMTDEKRLEEIHRISLKPGNFDSIIQSLCNSTLQLCESEFKKTILHCIKKLGVEQTIIQVIYPYLHKVGIMWQTGMINPAQEHFGSNLIKQRLIIAIDQIKCSLNKSNKKFLLFLQEGEFHEIALLVAHFIIRSHGYEVLYLGQNLPIQYVEGVYSAYQPNYILSVLTNSISEEELKGKLDLMSQNFGNTPVLLAGACISTHQLKAHQNIVPLYEISDLYAFINEISFNELDTNPSIQAHLKGLVN